MSFTLSLLPIVFLVYVMTKKHSWPSHIALPVTAAILFLTRLFYFQDNFTTLSAKVIEGIFSALTPILIVWGAIYLFNSMEKVGALKTLRRWLESISSNQIAQLMLVGWAFEFLIEGASGFGTPAALAAPILVGLGFQPVRVAIFCLVMNSVPVSFGAVGTPTWFGFKELNFSEAQMLAMGFKSAVLHFFPALIVPIIALSFIVTWEKIRKNIIFILLSIVSCTIPYMILARFDYEFPSIVGGLSGVLVTAFLASKGIGLEKEEVQERPRVSLVELIKASFPIWGTVLALLLTRIKSIGLNKLLRDGSEFISMNAGLAEIHLSPSLVVSLQKILGTDVSSKLELLYVPSLIPFILISMLSFKLFKSSKQDIKEVTMLSTKRMIYPGIALFGALAFVKILMMGGDNSSAQILGTQLASALGNQWQFAASYLGALGSFFSGSATISNLTFCGIQNSAALQLGLDQTTIAAMQSVGGSMGNMVCIHNIVAVSTVLGLEKQEGFILKRTVVTMVIYGVVAGITSAIIF